jgi:hypothetical protein
MRRLLWALLCWPITHALAAEPSDCLAIAPLPMVVQIGTSAPRPVLLIGGSAPALRLIDPATGEVLWSAGSTAPATQRFAAMTAAFAGGFIALDTDHDGLDDRIYGGDMAGRIWRFDLHNGANAEAWASGGVFADFSNDAGRGFLAPPDVSLATAPGKAPWLHIAIGTAAPGRPDANNRFYVLRDQAPFESWTDQQYSDWQPLRESDLLQVETAGEPPAARIEAGWYVELGHGDILSAALTVAGRTVFAVSETSLALAVGCRSAFSTATLALAAGRIEHDAGGNWRQPLGGEMPLDSTFAMLALSDPQAPRALCSFGDAQVADCNVDLSPHRTWWRREDAE